MLQQLQRWFAQIKQWRLSRLLYGIYDKYGAAELLTYAAGIAFHAVLALFPFLVFVVALTGFLDVPSVFSWIIERAYELFPWAPLEQIVEVLESVRGEGSGQLAAVALVVSIWTASGAVRSVMKALSKVSGHHISGLIRRYLLSFMWTIVAAIVLLLAAGALMLGGNTGLWLARQVDMGDAFVAIWNWLRWPFIAALLMLSVSFVYYIAAAVKTGFKPVTTGSAVAVFAWFLGSLLFQLYVTNFSRYGVIYGSLGAGLVLLLYAYFCANALLLGSVVNAVLRERSAA